MTNIPAEPGFVVVIPLFDDDGVAGFAEHPVIGWRTEGKWLGGRFGAKFSLARRCKVLTRSQGQRLV